VCFRKCEGANFVHVTGDSVRRNEGRRFTRIVLTCGVKKVFLKIFFVDLEGFVFVDCAQFH
jgi:hypothetical protein